MHETIAALGLSAASTLAVGRVLVTADRVIGGRRGKRTNRSSKRTERSRDMCLTCGCMLPHDDHGKADYLTIEDLEKSAVLDGLSLDQAVQNLIETVEVAKQERGHAHR